MKKIIIAVAGVIALAMLAIHAMPLPDLEAPVWILRDAGKTIYVFETIRLV
jgi:hypothetical protein